MSLRSRHCSCGLPTHESALCAAVLGTQLMCEDIIECEADIECEGDTECEADTKCEGDTECEGDTKCEGHTVCEGHTECEGDTANNIHSKSLWAVWIASLTALRLLILC